jgi:hypothetical protein
LSDVFEGLMVLIKEVLWQLTHVLAVLKLSGCDLGGVLEISILIKNFMNFILDFGFQVQILE